MVVVRFFAGFRERIGRGEVVLETGGERTLLEVLELLDREAPGLLGLYKEGKALVAVNGEIAGKDTKVREGDELAIFPPVSGG
ncbi:MAG: MoaD/ThiS family protein [Candidatus Hydrothermarchaeota archaeon]